MTAPRLIAIELEGFRGFAKAQRLDLDADAILIRGANGTGKTSLVDGFLWLFCGELGYLAERVRKLRRSESVIQSRFTNVQARVSLELQVDEHSFRFERAGDDKNTTFEGTRDGTALDAPERALASVFGHGSVDSFRDAVVTWGLLRQDAVRAALDAAGGALHERLASIVGLEEVTSFATAASTSARALQTERTAARKALAVLRQRHDEAVQRHQAVQRDASGSSREMPELQARLGAVLAKLSPNMSFGLPATLDAAMLADLGSALAAMAPALSELLRKRESLDELSTGAENAVGIAERDLENARAQLAAAAREGPATTRLARAALDTLSGGVCPVCGQDVNERQLRAHLEEVLRDADEAVASAQRASDAVALATSRVSELRDRQRRALERKQEAEDAAISVRAIAERFSHLQPAISIPEETQPLAELVRKLDEVIGELRSLYREVSAASGAHTERLANEAAALRSELADAEAELRDLEGRYDRAKALERAAHDAADRIVARALKQLEPGFAEVFDRLNPNPAFTELRARQDVLRNVNQVVPMVRDPERGVEANPLLVFSEGQLNVVALSYFLGMALNAREAMLPFLILDDPVQALDTIAVLGFGDLSRRVRLERQLILTTHDRRFGDILARKLAPRERDETTIIHDFDGWTRGGPVIRTTAPELAEVIPLLRRRAS